MFKLKKNRAQEMANREKFESALVGEGEEAVEIFWEGELAVGTEVFVMTEEEMTPAPEGTHIVTGGDAPEGTQVVLDVDGVVTEVIAPTEAKEEEEEEMEVTLSKEEVKTLIETLDLYEAKIVKQSKEIAKAKEEFAAQIAEVNEKIEKFGKEAPKPEKQKAPVKMKNVNPAYYRK